MKKLFGKDMRMWLTVPRKKKENNKKLFSIVAPKYDFVTRALSCGRDSVWKKILVKKLPNIRDPHCVDIACGTGDITFLLANRFSYGTIHGIDLTKEMITIASRKNNFTNVSFSVQDMSTISTPDESVDIITGGYALRNAPDLNKVLQEVYRVLKKGGTAAFLDFSKPSTKTLHYFEYIILTMWGSMW